MNAKRGAVNVSVDNLDIDNNHLTQVVWEFEEDDLSQYPDDDELTLDEALELWTVDSFMLDSEQNTDLREHVGIIAVNTIGRLIGKERKDQGFEYLLDEFPENYPHDNQDTAGLRSKLFHDNPIPLNENKTPEMCTILEEIQTKYLMAVEMSLTDEKKEQFEIDVKAMMSKETEVATRKEAEERIWKSSKQYGQLILTGDQLTCERVNGAKAARAQSATIFERLLFIKTTRIGLFHMGMNKTITDLQARMKALVNSQDRCSLAYIRTDTQLVHISNKDNEIKKDLTSHQHFTEQVGQACILQVSVIH